MSVSVGRALQATPGVGQRPLPARTLVRGTGATVGLVFFTATLALALPAAGCGAASPAPPPSTPSVQRALERGAALHQAQRYEAAIEAFLEALVHAESEDDLYGRIVGYLSVASGQLRVGNLRLAREAFAAADSLLPLLEREQPNLDAVDVDLLAARYHEMRATLLVAEDRLDEARAAIDRASDHYEAARDS